MSNMAPQKIFIIIVLNINKPFHWMCNSLRKLIYVLPIDGLYELTFK